MWWTALDPYCLLPTACCPLLYSMMTSGSPNSTGWPFSTRICVTLPPCGAGIWFIVFMASMMSTVSPCSTRDANLDERRRAGLRRAIGGADHRRLDGAGMLRGVGGCRLARRAGCRCRCGGCGDRMLDREGARHPYLEAALLDLDLATDRSRSEARRARGSAAARSPMLRFDPSFDPWPSCVSFPLSAALVAAVSRL